MPFDARFDDAEESALAAAAPGERVRLRLSADLDFDRRYHPVRIAITDARACVLLDGRCLLALPLAQIRSAACDELFGSGRLSVRTDDGERVLAYYSRTFVPEFAAAARVIDELVAGREPVLPDEIGVSACARCRAPLPERGATCPLCVPRGRILLRLLTLVRPHRGRAALLVGTTLVGVAATMVPPWAFKEITDHVIVARDASALPKWIGIMMAAFAAGMVGRLIANWLATWLSARVVSELQNRLHAHLIRLRMAWHGKREPGEIVGRIMNDTHTLQHFLKDGLPYLLVNCISLVAIAVILVCLNPFLAMLVFLPVPILVIGGAWFWKRLIPLYHQQGARTNRLHTLIAESIRGVRVVKALTQEDRRAREFAGTNEQVFRTNVATETTYFAFFEVLALVMAVGTCLVWWFGAQGVIASGDQGPTLGDLMAFAGYMALFYGPLTWFAAILNWMTSAFAGAERIFSVLDQVPEPEGAEASADEPRMRGAVAFRDVRFSYERGKEVLKGVSFDVPEGTMLGLVGRSGAGKSTIIGLLARFHQPDHGAILVDGAPLSELPLGRFRRQVGIVMQDPFLFRGSILDNIRYGRPEAGFAEVVEAAKAAHCNDFILEREDGYDTMVGEGGAELSGGERQRLSIARAILSDPRILILDEATSAVDSETEKAIQEAIQRLIQGRTTIAIAHRLATLRCAHRLAVIDEGRVVEQGTHEELLARPDGHFAKLVRLQAEINRVKAESIVEVA